MALTGKTGADAIFIALKHICHVITRYELKLNNVVIAAQGAGAITAGQATTINSFLSLASAACTAFQALSQYSGF
jgi:hypothetical protein